MALDVAGVKKAVNLSWDPAELQGDLCRIIARNEETGGVSNTNWSKNDGYGVLTYPLDFEGTTKVLVEGSQGGSEVGTVVITADGASIEDDDGTDPVEPPDTEPPPDLSIWPDPPEGVAPIPEHPIWDSEAPHVEHHDS